MEAVGFAASVIGLLAACGKIINLVNGMKLPAKEQLRDLKSEVRAVELILTAMIKLFGRPEERDEKFMLVPISALATIISDCVITFGELEMEVKKLSVLCNKGSFLGSKWSFSGAIDDVNRLLMTVQRQKASLSLLLQLRKM